MGYLIVSESINCILCNKNLATTGALFALGKTCFGTGGCNRIKNYYIPSCVIVRKWCNNICFKCITIRTIATLGAVLCLGGLLSYVPFAKAVPVGRYSYSISAKLCIADRAVYYVIVRAGVSAVGCYIVFNFSFAIGMTECRLFCIGRVIATRAGNVSAPAYLGTSGSFCFVVNLVVSKSRLFRIGRVVATRAGYVSIPTNLGASGSFSYMAYLIVTESLYDLGVAIGAE